MKKIFSLVIAFALTISTAIAATSCGGNSDDNVLKVGMECGYQPYNWTQFDDSNGAVPIEGKTGQYANGYDVIISKNIAASLGKTHKIYAYEWESLIPAVESGALDFIIAGMSPTEERKQKIDFSAPYYESNLVIVVRKDGAYASATSIADFSGSKIVAQSGTFHDEVIDQISGVLHQTPMDDFPTMIVALNSKTIDGYIAEEPGAIADCKANPDFTYIHLVNNESGFTITDLSNVTLAVGLKKNSSLLDGVNSYLNSLTGRDRASFMNLAIDWAAALSE